MTVRPLDARELLDCADMLAGVRSGPGRPRTVDLRRATSTAYYAAFHQLTRHGARWTVPHGSAGQEGAVTRWFTHTSVDKAARLIVSMSSGSRAVGQTGARALFPASIPHPLVVVATAFSSLQERRHAADYDHDFDATRSATLGDVERARALVNESDDLWNTQDMHYLNFPLVALALPVVKNR